MRWNAAHQGNVRQAPIGDQEVVNPEMKVPEAQMPVEEEDVEATPQRRDADATPKADAPTKGVSQDKPSAHAEPKADASHQAESKK